MQRRNLRILERLYPGYHRLVMAHIAADPLRPARARLDAQRLAATQDGRELVLLITHSHGGGVARQEAAERQDWRARGFRPLLLRPKFPKNPERTPYPWPAMLSEADEEHSNLVFSLPRQKQDLLRLLRALRVTKIVLHHMLGHDESVRDLAAALGLKQTIVIHDYASFCPRVNLLRPEAGDAPRYCGEPGPEGCAACCAADPDGLVTALSAPDAARAKRKSLRGGRHYRPLGRRSAAHHPAFSQGPPSGHTLGGSFAPCPAPACDRFSADRGDRRHRAGERPACSARLRARRGGAAAGAGIHRHRQQRR